MTDREPSQGNVICSCCGAIVADTAAENVEHGQLPSPGDRGTGICRDCGGDPEAETPRQRLGFAVTAFVDARIPFVAERLSRDNRQRFFAMPYEEQAEFILRLVAKGVIT